LQNQGAATLGDYLTTLRRRAWIILVAAALATAAALLYSTHQPRRFAATAQVLLNQNTVAASGGQTVNAQDAARYDETQAQVAVTPVLARQVAIASGIRGLTADQLLQETAITADPNSDILTIHVTDPSGPRALALANDYANQFVLYRHQLDTAAARRSLTGVDVHLHELSAQLAAAAKASSPSVASLRYKVNQLSIEDQNLRSFLALAGGSATVFNGAQKFEQTQPKVVRDTIIGAMLGFALGLSLAFAAEGLETRIRRPDEVSKDLGVPVLGRITNFPRRVQRTGTLVMLGDHGQTNMEPYRRLGVTLKYVTNGRNVKKVLVTSAVNAEGKSTTAANLALACARSGMRVALVDLDLHSPTLHRLFGVSQTPGVAGVATGDATLEEATVNVQVGVGGAAVADAHSNGHRDVPFSAPAETSGGKLDLIPAGVPLYDPGEFIHTTPVEEILDTLAEDADLVLVDSPPVLPVSDVLTLSREVDGILVVARAKVLTKSAMEDLRGQLAALSSPTLGVAFIGAKRDAGYGYGYGYGYGGERKGWLHRRRTQQAPLPRPLATSVSDAGQMPD
jgi:Mrp family chromosome partitioning ATPase